MSGGASTTDDAARLAEAHRALAADPSVQFSMRPVDPPAPPPTLPHWLKAVGEFLGRLFRPIGRFFDWLFGQLPGGPWAKGLLWTVVIALAALLVWMIVTRFRTGEWRLPRRRRARAVAVELEEESWAPAPDQTRALLRDADALAAQGRFAEAVHLLLLRGVEHISSRRPQLVRPALTSRDLAAAEAIPLGPRSLFARIAGIVERSLFGGGAVGESEWRDARGAYADFALPRAWAARG